MIFRDQIQGICKVREVIYKPDQKNSINVNQTKNHVIRNNSRASSFDATNKKYVKTLYRILLLAAGIVTAVLCISVIL